MANQRIAVSADIVLDTMIVRLLTIAVENAGAERGLLVLGRDGELHVEALAAATPDGVQVRLAPPGAIASIAPETMLRYVARTRESVSLGDASEPGRFGDDAYVRAARVRSALCLPLVKQSHFIGALYLENNHLPFVFTPRRIALLELLVSQAAVSLENARLHTDLRTAQEQLRRAVRENRRMIDAIPGCTWCARIDGSVEFVNQPWLDYTGLGMDQVVDWGWARAIHPDDIAEVTRVWQTCISSGTAGEVEGRMRRHDGVYRWFLHRARPLLDENGRVARWYGTNTDIEERKRAEDALHRSEELLLEAQRIGQTGSFSWIPASGEISWSRETYRIYEIEPGERPLVQMVLERTHPDDVERTRGFLERAARDGRDWADERRLIMPDDRTKHVHVIAHAFRDDRGRSGFAGFVKDVTAAKREAERLVAALSEKEALLKEVHHRVKNNLQLISSLLSLQAGRSADRRVAELFADSRNRVRSMALVHENLYRAGDFSRVPMADHVTRLCRELASIHRSDGQHVELTATSSDLHLDMDRAVACGLIIVELVSNAFKHAFPGGRPGVVSVELAPAGGDRHVLTVRDDGVGIPEGLDVDRLPSLGLQLVHDLTEQLHGTIAVTGRGGTRFAVTFAARDDGGGERGP